MRYQRSDDMTWDDTAERVVILDAEGSTMFTLNPVGSLLWSHLGEPCSGDDLVAHLREHFPEVDTDDLRGDVDEFLSDMVDEGLVVAGPDE